MLSFLSKRIRFAVRSPKWSSVRKQHLLKQPQCQACGKTHKLEVHHIIPVHLDPSKELDLDNLITLCDNNCHLTFGHLMDYKSWNKDVIQDVANFYNKVKNKP